MCGIAGLVQLDDRPFDSPLLEAMTRALAHRGPDGEGYVLLSLDRHDKPFPVAGSLEPPSGRGRLLPASFRVGLGHRRLAIVDLTPLGHQPMGTEDGLLWITYNGEVYNAPELRRELAEAGHRFLSASDTEVVLAAYREWGVECLSRFNGMFAFAVWDAREQALFCARDRFGIKPFYFRRDGGRFLFGSEIKALLADPAYRARPNDARLYDYLTRGFLDHRTGTCFAGIHQLGPGEWMKVFPHATRAGGQRLGLVRERWWHLPTAVRSVAPDEAIEGTRALLHEAVSLQLRADVPVGSCLSGGLDSSSIVCLMARESAGRATPVTVSSCFDDPAYDERAYIGHVVAATGVVNHQVCPDPMALYAAMPAWMRHQEEPVAGTSILAQWAVMQAASQAGIKVVLDGQGADELLFGYPGFMGSRLADLVRQRRWGTAVEEWRAWKQIHGGLHATAWAGLVRGLVPCGLAARLRVCIMQEDDWMPAPFIRDHRGALEAAAGQEDTRASVLQSHMARAIRHDLPALLHYEDRNSMAFSVEARVPFLDHRLVEWLAALPPETKLASGMTKVVLREAMRGILPEAVRTRKDKMGFVTPQDRWLRVALKPEIDSLLASDRMRSRPYWKRDMLRDRYARYCAGDLSIGPIVWRWVNTEWWLRTYCD